MKSLLYSQRKLLIFCFMHQSSFKTISIHLMKQLLACQFFSNILRMNNFTQIVLNRTLNPLDLMTNDPAFIGICCFITVIVQIFGNGNLLVMMIYEKCGMDPQKRTVNNQLIFNLCFSNLVQNLISCHLVTYRFLVSPLGKNKPNYM